MAELPKRAGAESTGMGIDILAQADTSIGGVIMTAATIAIGVVVSYIGWSLARLVRTNDSDHDELRKELKDAIRSLADQVQAEREARHQFYKASDDRVWTLSGEMRENYAKRVEVMRSHGTLMQTIERNHHEVVDGLAALPCSAKRCPSGEST